MNTLPEKISLITSLYRSEKHLPLYGQRVQALSTKLDQTELHYEIIVVANDPTEAEIHHLELIKEAMPSNIRFVDVPRETIYASWNRGIELAEGNIIGFWNVDDNRTVEGLVEAYQKLTSGFELVDLPYYFEYPEKRSRLITDLYNPAVISHKYCCPGTFFMFRRELFEAAGAFNGNFRIMGDFEWGARQRVRNAIYDTTNAIGGRYFLHQTNLSNQRNPLDWVEINTVLLWNELYSRIRPVDPALMRQAWESWGYKGGEIPQPVMEWLWGDRAQERYLQYTQERAAPAWLRRLRLALARHGLFPSVEWVVHNKTNQPLDWDK